jgi:hypothetical protein
LPRGKRSLHALKDFSHNDIIYSIGGYTGSFYRFFAGGYRQIPGLNVFKTSHKFADGGSTATDHYHIVYFHSGYLHGFPTKFAQKFKLPSLYVKGVGGVI